MKKGLGIRGWGLVAAAVGMLCLATTGWAEVPIIPAKEAINHVGETAMVYGEVVGTRYAAKSRGGPTFLNLEEKYPNQIFTVVIWRSDRDKFPGDPETIYKGKKICVYGVIKSYRGVAEMVVKEPRNIRVYEGKKP